MDPPGQMQTPARHIGPRVQVLNFSPQFSMGNFKNRLAAKNHSDFDRTTSLVGPKGMSGPLDVWEGPAGLVGPTGPPLRAWG